MSLRFLSPSALALSVTLFACSGAPPSATSPSSPAPEAPPSEAAQASHSKPGHHGPGAGEHAEHHGDHAEHHADHAEHHGDHGDHGEHHGGQGEHPEHHGEHGEQGEHAGHHGEQGEAFAGPPTHRFDDAKHWAKVFDDPARDEWQRPDELIDYLALKPDHVVVDLGAGTGYFAVKLAARVPKGKVIAIDIEPNLVKYMKERAKHAGLRNFVAQLGKANDPGLETAADVILVVDTYHHIFERSKYFGALKGKLRAGGRVVIVDFKKGKLPVGPPDSHKMAPGQVEKEMGAAGFKRCASFDKLPYQYVLSFGVSCSRPAAGR